MDFQLIVTNNMGSPGVVNAFDLGKMLIIGKTRVYEDSLFL
jgi:hypothetical protein